MKKQFWTLDEKTHTESRLVFTTPDFDEAIGWMKEKSKKNDGPDFWWVLRSCDEHDVLFGETDSPANSFVFNKKGQEILWEPAPGESAYKYGDILHVRFKDPLKGPDFVFDLVGVFAFVENGSVLFKKAHFTNKEGQKIFNHTELESEMKTDCVQLVKKVS